MHIYPKDISEFKDKDVYEIKYSSRDEWYTNKVYSVGDCSNKKNYIKYLILHNRIRIVKGDKKHKKYKK